MSDRYRGPERLASLKLGAGGASLTGALTASASLNFPSIATNTTADLTVAVTGAVVNDVCLLGPPVLVAGLSASAFVSAANTVTVRLANDSAAAIDPAAQTYRVLVLKAA